MSDWNTTARLNAAERRIDALTRERPASERDDLATAQARADGVARQFGGTASAPVPGETPVSYRKRLLTAFLPHSARFKGARVDGLDMPSLGAIEDAVYHDAAAAARRPESYPPGTLRPVVTREAGRDVTRFVGDMSSWLTPYMSGGAAGSFNRNPNGNQS